MMDTAGEDRTVYVLSHPSRTTCSWCGVPVGEESVAEKFASRCGREVSLLCRKCHTIGDHASYFYRGWHVRVSGMFHYRSSTAASHRSKGKALTLAAAVTAIDELIDRCRPVASERMPANACDEIRTWLTSRGDRLVYAVMMHTSDRQTVWVEGLELVD